MELKQLRSFVAVVRYKSFTKAAEKTYISQPTISSHIRALEEELQSRLIIRNTKNVEITPKGMELYECANHMFELHDNLLQRWSEQAKTIIRLGASTLPSAHILPEILPQYGKKHPDIYFIVQQNTNDEVVKGLLNGLLDVGMIGVDCESETIRCVPFYKDRMVLITPVNERFLPMQDLPEPPIEQLLREPIILREKNGSLKNSDLFLESMNIPEEELKVTARVNDHESVKNLVASGLGVSIISEKAAKNFVEAKRVLMFPLLKNNMERNLYLAHPREGGSCAVARQFVKFAQEYYST